MINDLTGITYPRVSTGVYKVKRDGEVLGHVRHSTRWSGFWSYTMDGSIAESTQWVSISGTRADAADHLLSARSPSAKWIDPGPLPLRSTRKYTHAVPPSPNARQRRLMRNGADLYNLSAH
jgi:hypothetical protein